MAHPGDSTERRCDGRPPDTLPRVDLARARTRLRLRGLDARDRLRGRTDPLVPPRRLLAAEHSDFATAGETYVAALTDYAGLTPDSRVLDVGCGLGGTARPLTRLLGPGGSYEGFDVDREAVGWCRRAYHRHPGFHFVVADVRDARRNPNGEHREDEYRFPYADDSFDVVLMTRMLAHLLPAACEHHLAEGARVLRPGGTLLATFFALNDTSRALMASGAAGLVFEGAEEAVAVLDDQLPEEAVAYADEWIFERLREQGLVLTGLHPGSWCGREEFMGFQDLLVAVRDA